MHGRDGPGKLLTSSCSTIRAAGARAVGGVEPNAARTCYTGLIRATPSSAGAALVDRDEPLSCQVVLLTYVRDMLVRVSTEPAGRVRELLPDRWKAENEAAAREVAAAVHDPPA